MKEGFVFLDEVLPGIRWDAKYATWDNFTGKPVAGYEANRIVASDALAAGLKAAKENAAAQGYGLLVWDAYRPQRAVDCFLRWAAQPEDGRTKERFYPGMERSEMVTQGYLAEKSGHSRGCAVDLTLFRLDTDELVPMGTAFDFMSERSHHGSPAVADAQAQNRLLLRIIMESSGFEAFAYEWWHYKLIDEPYPREYFDFPVGP